MIHARIVLGLRRVISVFLVGVLLTQAISLPVAAEESLVSTDPVPMPEIVAPAPEVLPDVAPQPKVAVQPEPALASQPTVPTVTPPTQSVPAPFAVAASETVLVSAFKITPQYGYDFVELHNASDTMTAVEGMSIHLRYSTLAPERDYECQIELHGYIRPNSYVTYTTRGDNDVAYTVSGCPHPGADLYDKEIVVMRGTQTTEIVRIGASDMSMTAKQWERKAFTASGRTGILTNDFKESSRAAYTSGLYETPTAPTLDFLEVFPHADLCSSGDVSPTCHPYIKVKNTGTSPVDLSRYRLRSGTPGATSSKYNTSSLSGTIAAGEYKVITTAADGKPLALNAEDGTTWLEDAYGLATYANDDAPYHDAELAAQAGKSWAFDSETKSWRWATPSPYAGQNTFVEPGEGDVVMDVSTLKPCADNQYRSLETNRCRSLVSSTSLTPCKEGQYRSEETNRCRSIASVAAAVLKPCADDQFRNPTTGRCKKIAAADDIPQPCAEGKERNPETNRCRNVVKSVPPAAYAVEPVKQGAAAFVGWWALGGMASIALGYAAWEWRDEARRGIKRVATLLSRRR